MGKGKIFFRLVFKYITHKPDLLQMKMTYKYSFFIKDKITTRFSSSGSCFLKMACFTFLFFTMGIVYGALATNTFDSIENQIDTYYFSEQGQSREWLDELYVLAYHSPDSSRLIPRCLYREAMLSYGQGMSDSTLIFRIQEHLSKLKRIIYPFEHALLLHASGLYFDASGDYSEAFSISLQSLESFKQLKDSLYVAKTLNLLGNICSHIKIYNMAQDYYSEALRWIGPRDIDFYRIKTNYYRLYISEGNAQQAIDSVEAFIPELIEINDPGILILNYNNLTTFYFTLKQYDKSYHYCLMAQKMLSEIDNPRLGATINQNIGLYYFFNNNDYKKALQHFYLAKETADHYRNFDQLSSIYYIMSHTYHALYQYDSAFYYMIQFQNLSTKLLDNPKAIEAYQAYISTFLEASENKLTIAQQKISLRNRQFVVLIIIAVSGILVTLLFLIIMRQKKRLKENENKELAAQLEHEKKIQQLEQEKQKEALEAKTREITSYSLQLSNKNNVLQEIQDATKRLPNNPKVVSEVNDKINKIINRNLSTDNDWENFKLHFDKVHPSFFDKLKSQCNDMTEDNLRMCAYFKIGMTTKQIAQIFNIAPNSVIVHRHRLKKKLGLGEEDSLDDYIRKM